MPDFPALPLGRPAVRDRTTRSSFRPTLRGPGPNRQETRLAPAFARLTAAFNAQRVAVPADPAAHEPELVLVLEIAGELNEFVNALRRVPGLEFLAEQMEDEVEPDDFAAVDREGRRRKYARQVFLVASDLSAWRELLSLWERFKRGDPFPRGFAQFRHLFELLRELRPWNDRDRLELGGAVEAWQRELQATGHELVHFETELWWRSDSGRRAANAAALREDVEEAGGSLVSAIELEEIQYHGVLCTAPASLLLEAAQLKEVQWLRTAGVRLFHASGQFAVPSPDEIVDEVLAIEPPTARPRAVEPRVALLDGLPIEAHGLLAGRIVVDDPDGWAETVPVDSRRHGTAMASLLIHGDLGAPGSPLSEPIYLRPILRSDAPDWVVGAPEELPRDRLPVDLVHGAVARLFEGERVAPGVRVIVLAVADGSQPFDRFVSPLARLVDWLSSRYGVAFLVAGGNHTATLELPEDFDPDGSPEEVQHEFLVALLRAAALRRPLSPAEAINAITVGASHSDRSDFAGDAIRLDPLVSPELATVIDPVGPGMRRSVKPELLMPGGRQLVRVEPPQNGHRRASLVVTTRAPGLQVAAPGQGGQVPRGTGHVCGTSGATALAGREMVNLLAEIDDLRTQFGDRLDDPTLDGVLAKAALVHRASWGAAGQAVTDAFNELGIGGQRDRTARLLGYGLAHPEDTLRCDSHQATVFAVGRIADGHAHAYSFPLPPSLAGTTARRRVTLTLAWLTPINPSHRAYRRAALALESLGDARAVFGDGAEITKNAARRGTLQHEVLEGQRAVPYASGTAIELVVSCRADAGSLDTDVPYALLLTVEVPPTLGLPIYDEVRQALRVPVRVQPTT
jgi:hypothetical protein